MDYIIIRRYGDGREDERYEWDGVAWPAEIDELKCRVAKVMAGDAAQPATIVLEPLDD